LSRRGRWKLPILNGIVQAPFLRIDGSLCETPGYDPASKLLFKAEGLFPPVPHQPSRAEALKALALLEDLISTFPFVGKADRSVALAAILTTMDRRSMATAPLFAFNSPVAGTGKSKLVDLCSILATGQPMSVISPGLYGRGVREVPECRIIGRRFRYLDR
jgi:putative DNA primase/helicase